MKIKIVLTGILGIALLAMAAPHTWTFKQGGAFDGDYFSSGTTVVVVRKDQAYIVKTKADQKRARLDAEVKQMQQTGMIELTAQLIENFPEKVHEKSGWMDAEFIELDASANPLGDGEQFASIELVLRVQDKNQDLFSHCVVPKELHGNNYFETHDLSDSKPNPLADVVANLKRYDKIRLIGKMSAPGTGYNSFSVGAFLNQ